MTDTITIVYRDVTPAEAVALGEHPKARASSWSDLMEERDRIERNRDMWKDQCAAQAQQIAQVRADAARADPMDWPLPCDVTVGHGTMRKGVKLRTLVARMKVLYEMATGNNADEVASRTPEQNAALADVFRATAMKEKTP